MGVSISGHAAAALLLTVIMFYGFASERLRVEIISLLTIGVIALGLYVAPLPGTRPSDGLTLAFEGFGHPALITICALMIMGRGLVVTGALEPAARGLRRVWLFNRQLGLLTTLLLAMFMSMMINDTPVLVLLLPILVQLAQQGGMPASRTLIPVNAAILIGGMATTIGTSTNLLVVSIASDLGMPSIGVFHYTPLVLAAAAIAFPYIWLVMPRLLPDTTGDVAPGVRRYMADFRIGSQSPLLGKMAAEARSALPEGLEMVRAGETLLSPGARLEVSGTEAELVEAMRLLDAQAAPIWVVDELRVESRASGHDLALAELAIATDSRLIGQSLQTARPVGVAVYGIHQAKRLVHETRPARSDAPLREGDVLLVMGTEERIALFAQADGLLQLAGSRELPRSAKAPLALAIMGGAVGLASIGLVPIAISALGGAILMFVTGCVKFERVGRALSAQVIVLVAASLAIGKLMLASGAAEWLGTVLAVAMVWLPPAGVLAAVMLFVTILTNFASNATAAAVGTPIAFSLAQKLGLPVEPMVLAVLFGCNLCYATPVAYQTNMLIMGEGGYQFRDYIRTGVPLVIIMITSLSGLLVWQYGL